jgi:hypothetical protein
MKSIKTQAEEAIVTYLRYFLATALRDRGKRVPSWNLNWVALECKFDVLLFHSDLVLDVLNLLFLGLLNNTLSPS